jgi:hypothetical protein
MSLPARAWWLIIVAAALAALQPWTLLLFGEVNPSSLGTLAAEPAVARRMFIVFLVFMPPMFVAYWTAARSFALGWPLTVSFASFAFGLWFALELLPRSFDLWVVQERWLPEFLAGDEPLRQRLEQRYAVYRDVGHAIAFVRRHALLLGQLLLASLLWRGGGWGRALSIALGASVLRLALGTFATYGGLHGLHAIADPLYFVTASTIFPLLAVWAWRQHLGAVRLSS